MERRQIASASAPATRSRRAESVDGLSRERLALYETVLWLAMWYATSLGTLLLNKIILSEHGVSSQALGLAQMLSTAALGAAKICWSRGDDAAPTNNPIPRSRDSSGDLAAKPRTDEQTRVAVRTTLVALGALRGLTVVLGLVSLAHVAASFTETIKSTAPLFTVYTSWLVLRQRTSWQVILSLVPVMLGLVICARTEVSFDVIGFWAAVGNNVVDCFQNVLSKKIVGTLGPVRLQFYTSMLAIAFQLPVLAGALPSLATPTAFALPPLDPGLRHAVGLVALNVCSYHMQSVSAYCVVDRLSPVSTSVANTLKRALLIVFTILWFGNKMTEESAGGVVVVVCGVALYNWARVRFPVVVDEGEPTTPRPQTLLETVSPRQRFSPKDVV